MISTPQTANAAPTWQNTDEDLTAAIKLRPGRPCEAQGQAAALYSQAQNIKNGPKGTVDEAWAETQSTIRQAIPPRAGVGTKPADTTAADVVLLRESLWLIDLFSHLLRLNQIQIAQIRSRAWLPQVATTPEVREILEAIPAWAEWLRRRDQREARKAVAVAADMQRERTTRPAILLARFRERGVPLSATKDGRLVAPPCSAMHAINPDDLSAVQDFKHEIIALLRAEQAARPKEIEVA